MTTPTLTFEEASIVLVGSFNPTIFHPAWLSKYNLIPAVEAEGAKVDIVHNELSSFSLGWLSVQVVHEKFIARTNDRSHYNPLRDLIISVFKILEHTPIKQLGMNRQMDFSVGNENDWHKIGNTLAPKEIWKKSLAEPLLTSLALESRRTDNLSGKINLRLEPSKRSKHGVLIDVNNHIELSDGEKLTVPTVLSEHWEKNMDKALEIATITLKEIIA